MMKALSGDDEGVVMMKALGGDKGVEW